MRTIALACWLALLVPASAWAQRGASGPIAELNQEAREFSESAPERSLAAAQKAREAAREARDVRGEAEALNYIAYAYRNQSLLEIAKQHALESIRLYAQVKDGWGEAQGYNTLGLIEADAGRFAEALEAHLRALALRERDGDKEGLAFSFNNLGNTHRNMGEYQKALEYHERGLALKIELGNRPSEAYSHHNIGLVHLELGDYPRALAAFRRGMAIREELGDERGIGVSLNSIGLVEAKTNPSAALRTYQRALALRRKTGDTRGEMATELNLADAYRRLGRYSEAATALNRVMALGDRLDTPLMRSNALKALAELEAARGNFAAAYKYQIQHQETRDRMFNDDNAARFQRLEAAHDAERRQRQIELLQREGALRDAELARVRTTRTALAAVAALVLVSVALLYARLRLKQQSEARLRKQADELSDALDRVQTLRGLLPICAWCKKVRDDNGYWTQVEAYVSDHSDAEFTHSICPSCSDRVAHDEPASATASPRAR